MLTTLGKHSEIYDGPRKKVLIIAYALSPVLGSEYRSAWELVNQISKYHNVTVLFGDSDGLMGKFGHFDNYLAKNDINFRAIKVEASNLQKLLANKMLKMPWMLLFPLLLRSWLKKAFKIAKNLHDEDPFDVAHQLGPIGFRNPGYLWRLDCNTYWGPIGGAQKINLNMIKNKKSAYFIEAILRNLSVSVQAYSPYISRAAKHYNKISFATIENAEYFKKHYHRVGPIVSDQGLFCGLKYPLTKDHLNKLSVAWVGSLTPRKNVDALIDTIKNCPRDVHFNIVGGGPLEPDVRQLANHHQNVKFHGVLEREHVMNILSENDAILLTSLSEANTAILFEAMENDCVPIAPRMNGFVTVLNDEVAFLIDQTHYAVTVQETASAIRSLLDIDTRQKMLQMLDRHKSKLTWNVLCKEHLSQYET